MIAADVMVPNMHQGRSAVSDFLLSNEFNYDL